MQLIHQNHNLITHQENQAKAIEQQTKLELVKKEEKHKEEIILEEFSGSHIPELIQMMSRDDDQVIREEFMYPYKVDQMDEEYLRSMFSSYRLRNDKYAALRISIKTGYGWKTLIGTAHLLQQNATEKKGLLAKFYISRIYRRSGFEEKCLIEIMKFAFDVMGLEKLIVFVNEQNQYFCKLLMWVHFRLIKMKPKAHGMYNRLMLSILKEDFQELISKHYKKIIKNRFYNSFMHDNYRDNSVNVLHNSNNGGGSSKMNRNSMVSQTQNPNNVRNKLASPHSEKSHAIKGLHSQGGTLAIAYVNDSNKSEKSRFQNNDPLMDKKRNKSSDSMPSTATGTQQQTILSPHQYSAIYPIQENNEKPLFDKVNVTPQSHKSVVSMHQSQSQMLSNLKKQVSLPKLNLASGGSNLNMPRNERQQIMSLNSPSSPMSKQAILEDINRLDQEIEQEQRSFYSLKHAKGIPSLDKLNSDKTIQKQKNLQSQQNITQNPQQQPIFKIPPINNRIQEGAGGDLTGKYSQSSNIQKISPNGVYLQQNFINMMQYQ
ncbi:UNKNOWN [Stylonychia lemnae]|uniref:N-acetyltransferase domain-containing protein n=1 Tax=Stylonychia lemnae TaxID=5949 RepID=A0A078AYI4_STYLE|nr:UNKNOWN [Stylonychia lemnae]|eukprot:CDW87475.1 UNKNOWN [Stylonychia lemnae]